MTVIDRKNVSADRLSDLKGRMKAELVSGGSELDETGRGDLPEEPGQRGPVAFTVACSGGCGKAFDLPEDLGVYVCHRCRMMSRA